SLLVAGLVTLGLLRAQPLVAQAAPKQEADPFASVLFPPELIMQHARAINLDDRQRAAITKLIEQLQGRAVGLQWQLAEQAQALKQRWVGRMVKKDRAPDKVTGVLERERETKRAIWELLIKTKTLLGREQRAEPTGWQNAAGGGKARGLERWGVGPRQCNDCR